MSEDSLKTWVRDKAPGFWRTIEQRESGQSGWPDMLGLVPQFTGDLVDVPSPRGFYTVLMELKYVEDWPKLPCGTHSATKTLPVSFRPGQDLWLWKHWAKGGLSFLLVKVGQEIWLAKGKDAIEIRKGWPCPVWHHRALQIHHPDDLPLCIAAAAMDNEPSVSPLTLVT